VEVIILAEKGEAYDELSAIFVRTGRGRRKLFS